MHILPFCSVMATPSNPEAQEAGKYIGLGLAISGTLAIGLSPRFFSDALEDSGGRGAGLDKLGMRVQS